MTTKLIGAFDAIMDVIFGAFKKLLKWAFIVAVCGTLYLIMLVSLGYSIVQS